MAIGINAITKMRRKLPCQCYGIYVRQLEQHAQELSEEMATWPEPIDVIRASLGLPERLRIRGRRFLQSLKPMPHPGIGELLFQTYNALNMPVTERCPRHDR